MSIVTIENFRSALVRGADSRLLGFLLVSLVAVGCSDGRPERFLVSGQVLIDGAPLTYGYIRFVPKDARPSGANLDEGGRFTLSCYEKKRRYNTRHA